MKYFGLMPVTSKYQVQIPCSFNQPEVTLRNTSQKANIFEKQLNLYREFSKNAKRGYECHNYYKFLF